MEHDREQGFKNSNAVAMFKMFKSSKEKPSFIYPVYQKINRVVNNSARKLADWLNRKAAKSSRRIIAVVLILFSLGWCAASVYVAMESFQYNKPVVNLMPITVPLNVYHPPDDATGAQMQRALKRITIFKHYMDSLQLHDPAAYKAIVNQRPGLMDSIAVIEQSLDGIH